MDFIKFISTFLILRYLKNFEVNRCDYVLSDKTLNSISR